MFRFPCINQIWTFWIKYIINIEVHIVGYLYRVSINFFPDYEHLLQENFMLQLS